MTRVLIVDDSPTAREMLAEVLSGDPDLEVIGFAEDGADAVVKVKELRPDVITMDLNMPVMDGFEATREIMIECPTPIVVVSATSRAAEVETAMQALQAGALNLLLKPGGPSSPEFSTRAKEIVKTVKAMAGVYVIRRSRKWMLEATGHGVAATGHGVAATGHASSTVPGSSSSSLVPTVQPRPIRAIAIAASTGGPPALLKILSGLPADFPVPVFLVQHIAAGFIEGFAKWLNDVVPVHVKVAEEHELVKPGTVYVAPHDQHLGVSRTRVRLSNSAPMDGFRPAGSYLFQTAADAFGRNVVGVILTGMGEDGVAGMRKIHLAGGITIAQDDAASAVFGMPRAAIEAGIVDSVLPLHSISNQLRMLAERK